MHSAPRQRLGAPPTLRDGDCEGYATFVDACESHKDNMWQIVHPPEE
jgi:hypothetical protein